MNHKDLLVDDMAKRKQAKGFTKELIEFFIILLGHFTLKAIELVHVPGLMISSGQVQMLGKGQLPCEELQDHLHREGASIHKVPVEQIGILLRGHPV